MYSCIAVWKWQIKWTPLANDGALLYAAEIQLWGDLSQVDTDATFDHEDQQQQPPPNWEIYVCDGKSGHSFYNLHAGKTYCIRIRAGFTKTKWGKPSAPIFAKVKKNLHQIAPSTKKLAR